MKRSPPYKYRFLSLGLKQWQLSRVSCCIYLIMNILLLLAFHTYVVGKLTPEDVIVSGEDFGPKRI